MDYERTEKYYTDAKQKYQKLSDQIEWEKWLKRVKDTAGGWNQNPHDRDTVYPLIKYNCFIRVMGRDGKEYLLTRSMHTGVNAYGDEQTHSIVDPEKYIETKWNQRRIQDPNDRTNIITEAAGVNSQKEIYTLPFSTEEIDKLYAQPDEQGIQLVVKDTRRDQPPREVLTIEDFKFKPFNELFEGPKIQANDNNSTRTSKAK